MDLNTPILKRFCVYAQGLEGSGGALIADIRADLAAAHESIQIQQSLRPVLRRRHHYSRSGRAHVLDLG